MLFLDQIEAWFAKYPSYKLLCKPYVLEAGEAIKNDFTIVEKLAKWLLEAKVCRHSYVIAVGGGAFLDAIGFVSSIFHRGVRHIRIPTTTLSQADSGVGVKNGINYLGTKNLLGCFSPPYAVINDLNYLRTLSPRDLLAGLAEAFKVGITKDEKFYQYLKEVAPKIKRADFQVIEKIVIRCAKIHHQHISSGDAFERSNSRPLDYGHWVAHRLESLSNNDLRHGEAVAIGLVFDSYCAVELGVLSDQIANDIYDSLSQAGFNLYNPLLNKKNNGKLEIFDGLEQFREHLGGELTLIMPKKIGQITTINHLSEQIVIKVVDKLQEKASSLCI